MASLNRQAGNDEIFWKWNVAALGVSWSSLKKTLALHYSLHLNFRGCFFSLWAYKQVSATSGALLFILNPFPNLSSSSLQRLLSSYLVVTILTVIWGHIYMLSLIKLWFWDMYFITSYSFSIARTHVHVV